MSGNEAGAVDLLPAERAEGVFSSTPAGPMFANPFNIRDLMVFDDPALKRILGADRADFSLRDLAWSLYNAPQPLLQRISCCVPSQRCSLFLRELCHSPRKGEIESAQRHVLDALFWELTYWKTPDLYEELTEGEQLHPGIFKQLEPDVSGKVVLDAGAGSGRATFECLRYSPRLVYAVEPSPGLLRILRQKSRHQPSGNRVMLLEGRFDAIPLHNKSVDLALACSSFTAQPEQGGERGLAELKRVTKQGGKIVFIWPRVEDYEWLKAHGFQGVTLETEREMTVHFRSLQSAMRSAKRFYARNRNVIHYLQQHHEPDVPFSVLGINPPRDYYWLVVN